MLAQQGPAALHRVGVLLEKAPSRGRWATTPPIEAMTLSPPLIGNYFLAVAEHVGRNPAGSPVYFGADRVKVESTFRLTISPQISDTVTDLVSDTIEENGSYSSSTRMPALRAGSYEVVLSGTHTNGATLELTCTITVDATGSYVTISDNVPVIR